MDIHELHDSHSSNLPAIIIIFSKTALPYTPNQLTWTLGISAFLISETKTLGRVKRLMAFIVLIRSGLAVNDCYASPLLPQGPAALSWMVGFDPHGVDMSAARSMGASWRILEQDELGMSNKNLEGVRQSIFSWQCMKCMTAQKRCWSKFLYFRNHNAAGHFACTEEALRNRSSTATVCVWTAVWLCVKL